MYSFSNRVRRARLAGRPAFPAGRHGFTLIELLLVIGIIAILASIVIVAINPTRQLGQARDAQRRADVNTILNAVYQYAIDNNGTLPPTMNSYNASTTGVICTSTAGPCGGATNYVDLVVLTKTGGYLVKLPHDPLVPASSGATGYRFMKAAAANGSRITVWAQNAEQTNGQYISVTR